MIGLTSRVIKDSVTGLDGESYDLTKIFAAITFFIAIGLQIYVVAWKGQPFDMLQFGTGMGAVFLAVGGALKLKETTEPGETFPVAKAGEGKSD